VPRNRQQIPKAERESALLEQARELFIAKGYRGTRIAEVGQAAGIASAAVHWYFPTKDDLFAVALRAVYSGLLQWLEDLLLQAISIRLPEGADTGLIADTAHVLFEGMLISARELDRPVGDLIDMVIDALVATAVAKLAIRSGSASRP
jgi:AcrR family transcriptional regulator